MKLKYIVLNTVALASISQFALAATIQHAPKDNVIRVYGPGGPHTAIIHAAKAFEKETGHKVEVTFGPQSRWTDSAQKNADLIFGSSEQSMTAFVENYAFISDDIVEPIYIRPAVLAVQKGNPKNIRGFNDLLSQPVKIIVTEGKGVYNTSGTGVWEDVAGRLGSLQDVKNIRSKIVSYEKGSGASFRAFQKYKADAWITWSHWPLTHKDKVDMVEIEPERRIYRDLTVAPTTNADPQTLTFIKFLKSDKALPYFKAEGWKR
ncbi:substrate-binding domain-containing protein [Algicola sagamiensis]|uniref:substrate-binding domain-containing protein n=1 Tax=Algicola sagamiensis TaxID=163869 RepID=UPI00037D6504|nr:substrate-binding domain-containing protein [Algicola sagamiensis]